MQALRHIGLYAYRAGFLRRFPSLAVSPLEQLESLEQLRVLWHGERIAVHMRGSGNGRHTTIPEHMPSSHRRYGDWTPAKIREEAQRIGLVDRVVPPEDLAATVDDYVGSLLSLSGNSHRLIKRLTGLVMAGTAHETEESRALRDGAVGHPDFVEDVSELFNHLTGYSNPHDYRKLIVAPVNLRAWSMEMIERETRRYALESIEHPDHPDFARAYQILWDVFGPTGEMEPESAIRSFLLEDSFEPLPSGTYCRYFLIVAKDRDGNLRGVRDGTVLYNPGWAPDLCTVYLSHINLLPQARGTVLTYWLRIAPVELAVEYLYQLQQRGLVQLPLPDQPGKNFGVRLNLAAEMEFFSPEDRLSLQRILFYGRGGFDVIDPRHFPYSQPDFRAPEVIAATGNRPVPFMLLLASMFFTSMYFTVRDCFITDDPTAP